MAKIGRKLSELELLEGGGGSGMMGGGGGRNPFTRPPAEKEFNRSPKREYTLSPQEQEAMVAYKTPSEKQKKTDGKKALVAAGLAAATDTPRKSTPEQRSNAKEKADRKDMPSFAETPSGYKKGGSVSSRADGIAQRGKTKGRMC